MYSGNLATKLWNLLPLSNGFFQCQRIVYIFIFSIFPYYRDFYQKFLRKMPKIYIKAVYLFFPFTTVYFFYFCSYIFLLKRLNVSNIQTLNHIHENVQNGPSVRSVIACQNNSIISVKTGELIKTCWCANNKKLHNLSKFINLIRSLWCQFGLSMVIYILTLKYRLVDS